MITITVENGSVVSGANSFISLADAETFLEARVSATAWSGATDEEKKAALVQAGRMLGYYVSWVGGVVSADQPMAWPRQGIVWDGDRYKTSASWPIDTGSYYVYGSDEIPQEVIDAQCELALSLLDSNTMQANALSGLSSLEVVGAVKLTVDTNRSPEIIPAHVKTMLRKWGTVKGASSGVVDTFRG